MRATTCTIAELSDAAVDALRTADVFPDRLVLRCGELPKNVYAEVDEALVRLGGQWHGRKRAHFFKFPVENKLKAILAGDDVFPAKNPTAFFPTSEALAAKVVAESRALHSVPVGGVVLEPGVGRAALVRALWAVRPDLVVEACEIDECHRSALAGEKIKFIGNDFLELHEDRLFDVIIANPPFAVDGDKWAWATHLEKMRRLLKDGGVLIAIVPTQIEFVQRRRVAELREWILSNGRIVANAPNAFTEAGTNVKTATIYFGPGEKEEVTATSTPPIEPLGSPEQYLAQAAQHLQDALAVFKELSCDLAGGAGESGDIDAPEPTSQNTYWREAKGAVYSRGDLWVDSTGAVLFWFGREAGEAQRALQTKADERKASVSKAAPIQVMANRAVA